MLKGRFLFGIIISVCLSIFSISFQCGLALEPEGSDQSRPSDSIKTEQPDTIKGEAGNQSSQSAGGKPDLDDPLDIDISTYKVKVTFDSVHIIANYETNSDLHRDPNNEAGTDYYPDGNEYVIYAYVQGIKIKLFYPSYERPHVRIANNSYQ